MDIAFNETECLFALEVTVAMCVFQLRSDVIVIPRYLADLTFPGPRCGGCIEI